MPVHKQWPAASLCIIALMYQPCQSAYETIGGSTDDFGSGLDDHDPFAETCERCDSSSNGCCSSSQTCKVCGGECCSSWKCCRNNICQPIRCLFDDSTTTTTTNPDGTETTTTTTTINPVALGVTVGVIVLLLILCCIGYSACKAAHGRALVTSGQAQAALEQVEVTLARSPKERMMEEAWVTFEPYISGAPNAPNAGHKLVALPEYFVFGSNDEFLAGLTTQAGLTRSMEQEFALNDGGRWQAEYTCVVLLDAIEVPDLPADQPLRQAAAAKYAAIGLPDGAKRKRNLGYGGKTLADFCNHQNAIDAKLTPAEVAALRLYTGPAYKPINDALRTRDRDSWATTIACCYSGVLKLSMLSKKGRVYRGVNETKRKLPAGFLDAAEGEFAGGVELGFMSTTTSAEVALQYAGKDQGSIFVIDFTKVSRGAEVQFLSQFPHEEELLFPPLTSLECKGHSQKATKRLVMVDAVVSTMRENTTSIQLPTTVP